VKFEVKEKSLGGVFSDVKAFEVKSKLVHKRVSEQNLPHFRFYTHTVDSLVKLFEWQVLKIVFVCIIWQFGREYSLMFSDFYTRLHDISLSPNPLAVDFNDVPAQIRKEVSE
jgi:hypothetical protein